MFKGIWDKLTESIIQWLSEYLGIVLSQDAAVRLLIPFAAVLLLPFVKRGLARGLMMVSWFRRLTDPRDALAGEWMETIVKAGITYYTLVSVRYSYSKNEYEIVGVALTEEGTKHADFSSHMITFFKDEDRVEVVYHATFADQRGETKGYASYSFRRIPSVLEPLGYRRFEKEGNGFIVDFRLDESEREPRRILAFDLERLDPGLVKLLIGKRRPQNSIDRRNLAISYRSSKLRTKAEQPKGVSREFK